MFSSKDATKEDDTLSMRDRMLSGHLYRINEKEAPELLADFEVSCRWMGIYNSPASSTMKLSERREMLSQFLGSVGENCYIRVPFHIEYGKNLHLGKGVFFNFNCVVLDICRIDIGDLTQIGPAVQIYAADHPRDPALRREMWESGKPVRIGKNCWIGGGAIILPGVSIGDDVIIGAGAVVNKSFGDGVTIAGNPARVIAKGHEKKTDNAGT